MSEKGVMGSVSDNLQFIEHRFFFYIVSISSMELEFQIYGHHIYAIKSFFVFFLPLLRKIVLYLQVYLTDRFITFLNFQIIKPAQEVLRMCPRTPKVPLGIVGFISKQSYLNPINSLRFA